MRFIFFSCCAFLLLISCSNNTTNSQVSRFYDDGRTRPLISLCSVIDSTSYTVPWSLSDELTQVLKKDLSAFKNLYIDSTDEIDSMLTNSNNPFDCNMNWMQDRFIDKEFIVFLELIKHEEEKKDTITNLNMSIRLKIIDVRAKEPKVILQECINDNYYIAKGDIKTNYQNTTWGSQEYENSRMGMAHKQLSKEIIQRIVDYVSLAKNR